MTFFFKFYYSTSMYHMDGTFSYASCKHGWNFSFLKQNYQLQIMGLHLEKKRSLLKSFLLKPVFHKIKAVDIFLYTFPWPFLSALGFFCSKTLICIFLFYFILLYSLYLRDNDGGRGANDGGQYLDFLKQSKPWLKRLQDKCDISWLCPNTLVGQDKRIRSKKISLG